MYRAARVTLLGASMVVLGGCASSAIQDPAWAGPFFVPSNVTGDPTLGGIRRVVLLPVWAGNVVPEETAADLDAVFRQALQDQNRFEIVTLTRADCQRRWGKGALASTGALPFDFISTLQRQFAADAVLFVDLTTHRAYHPLALGVRARLAVLNNSHVVWAFDNVFSASDPTVVAAARRHFLKSGHHGVPADMSPAVLQSPGRFATYVAHTTFATLPPVTLGNSTQTSASKR